MHQQYTEPKFTSVGQHTSEPHRRPGPPPPPAPAPEHTQTGQPPQTPQAEPAWYLRIFDNHYIRSVPTVSDRILNIQAKFFISGLGLDQKSHILDLACGTGCHTWRLTRGGFRVTGLDYSQAMLEEAKREVASRLPDRFPRPTLLRQDMRHIDFQSEFDGVLLAGTSFGYFSHQENLNLLQKINQSLKRGGRLLIETVNRDYIQSELPSHSIWRSNDILVSEEVNFDFRTSVLDSVRQMVFDDGRTRADSISIRLYSLHEFGQMLASAGFIMEAVSGGISCGPWFPGSNSPRLVMVAKKVKS